MSSELDHIQLSPLLVGELYKDALLLSPDGPPAIDRPAEQAQQPAAKTAAVQPVAIPAPVQPAAKGPGGPERAAGPSGFGGAVAGQGPAGGAATEVAPA